MERQASIIAAAASLFAVNGFKGTTTRKIAKTAGIIEATKHALYAAILAEKVPISDTKCQIVFGLSYYNGNLPSLIHQGSATFHSLSLYDGQFL